MKAAEIRREQSIILEENKGFNNFMLSMSSFGLPATGYGIWDFEH